MSSRHDLIPGQEIKL